MQVTIHRNIRGRYLDDSVDMEIVTDLPMVPRVGDSVALPAHADNMTVKQVLISTQRVDVILRSAISNGRLEVAIARMIDRGWHYTEVYKMPPGFNDREEQPVERTEYNIG